MIGADTLRADRLGALGYRRALTPNLDRLAEDGTLFGNCYVPCARTAPSLASLFTGQWPQSHGIRDNFIDSQTARGVGPGFPAHLRELGYRCSALSDWCGADLGKFDFGFDELLVPPDQWNLKYLIRQGPKDLRLLLSLFCQNPLGRRLLPEVHFLGGVPGSSRLGRRARRLLGRLARDPRPFLLNVFFSTTHPPFASEWPWYVRHADPAYRGESRFAMARLNDPFEIIRRQGEPRTEFDLDQIVDLYDGCVAQFDHEVGLLLAELTRCGLADNTLVLVYSDHGMEFFEHDTWGQGNSALGEASPRIPLIIKDPRHSGRGVISEPIRSVDVAPTLLDLVGDTSALPRDGYNLARFLRRETALPQADVFNETGLWLTRPPGQADDHLHYPELFELLEVPELQEGSLAIKPEYAAIVVAAKDRMIRRGRWKLVMQPATAGCREMLFDLEADPDCRTDLAANHPEQVAELREALEAWWRGSPSAAQVSTASASMRPATDAHP
jgi:arylsulfatase A-like enzyme